MRFRPVCLSSRQQPRPHARVWACAARDEHPVCLRVPLLLRQPEAYSNVLAACLQISSGSVYSLHKSSTRAYIHKVFGQAHPCEWLLR